jgi:lambda repressor-like predicted transcriptional regulator
MHPADIQAALKKKGIRQKQIAEDLDVSQFHVSDVINNCVVRRSMRVMTAVAAKIGLPVEEVFPDCFPSPRPSPSRGEGDIETASPAGGEGVKGEEPGSTEPESQSESYQ